MMKKFTISRNQKDSSCWWSWWNPKGCWDSCCWGASKSCENGVVFLLKIFENYNPNPRLTYKTVNYPSKPLHSRRDFSYSAIIKTQLVFDIFFCFVSFLFVWNNKMLMKWTWNVYRKSTSIRHTPVRLNTESFPYSNSIKSRCQCRSFVDFFLPIIHNIRLATRLCWQYDHFRVSRLTY